ncbi:MAG: PAS domain-containing protein [Pseudomonadota bacterium]
MQEPLDTANADLVALRDMGFANPERTASMMACTLDCIKLLNPDGRIGYMSHNGRCAMDICDLNQVLGATWWTLWPEERREMVKASVDYARAGRTANFVADCPTATGRPARWDVTVQGVTDSDGTVVEIMAVSRHTHDPERALTCY